MAGKHLENRVLIYPTSIDILCVISLSCVNFLFGPTVILFSPSWFSLTLYLTRLRSQACDESCNPAYKRVRHQVV